MHSTYQGRASDMSAAESGSDVDDACSPTAQRCSSFPCLDPVHEEVIPRNWDVMSLITLCVLNAVL